MNRTAKDISQLLSSRAESVARHLLPNGKKNGAEWEAGSVNGESGRSLRVRINGEKAGVWSDFASTEMRGDLLDLWAAVRGCRLSSAIQEAKQYLGIPETKFEPNGKAYVKPKKNGMVALRPESQVMAYLKNERKLTAESIGKYRLAESGDFIVFPYISPSGELLNVKRISIKRDADGKKQVFTEAGCAPALFGWQAIPAGDRQIAITEGEIDAITMTQYGMPALSVPFGAGTGSKNDWINLEWENLEQFDLIYLCYDNDEAGQAAVGEVARRLGIHRCKLVTLPFKDANECLQKGIDGGEIARCFQHAKAIQPPEICEPLQFKQGVIDYFHPPAGKPPGFHPFPFNGRIAFRPGELTIWTGISSHGKSLLLGEIMIFAILDGYKVGVASMEMKPVQTLGRMLRQIFVTDKPSELQINNGLGWLSGQVWIYDVLGNIPPEKLIELMTYSSCRHGVNHFVIDSLMKCSVNSKDWDAQRLFLDDLTSFAKHHNCHIHLVAHQRKSKNEEEVGGKMEIKGSSDIFNQADNCITVWRNKAKEERVRSGETYSTSDPDAIVFCDKQRETGWEGKIPLYFHRDSLQFGHKENDESGRPKVWEYNFWKKVPASNPEIVEKES